VQVIARGAQEGMKKDEHGFLLVNFKRLLEREQPFVFPSQIKQVLFLDSTHEPS
jgi:hypothetical protein